MGVSLEQRSDSLGALKLDEVSSTLFYVGESSIAAPTSSPMWRIRKIDTTTGVDVKWADGDAFYNNVWDDRASLTYL
jgi:hypothetical protein